MPKNSPRPTAGRKPASPTGERGFAKKFWVYLGEPAQVEEFLKRLRESQREAIERQNEA